MPEHIRSLRAADSERVAVTAAASTRNLRDMPYPDEPGLREAVGALLAESWTRLPAAIERARGWGADWCELSTPFVAREGSRIVAHVGVIELQLVLDGRTCTRAGIHAVCTARDRRGRGLMRRTLEQALAWVDARYEGALLWANDPDIYGRFGFVAREESIFVVRQRGGEGRVEPLSLDAAADRERVWTHLARRSPVSLRSGSAREAAALELLDLALWRNRPCLAHLPELDAIVVYALRGPYLDLYDVIAEGAPRLADIAGQLGARIEHVVVYFSPERLACTPELVEPTSLPDVLMTRGGWPLAHEPFAVPPLARC
jgi:predicted N-acetyltransferase YhbS